MCPSPALARVVGSALIVAALATPAAPLARPWDFLGPIDPSSQLSCNEAWEAIDLAVSEHVVHHALTPALAGRARDLLVERLVAGAPWLLASDVATLRAQAASTSPGALLDERREGGCDHVAAQLEVVDAALARAERAYPDATALASRLPVRAPSSAPDGPPLPLRDVGALRQFMERSALRHALAVAGDAPWQEAVAFGARRALRQVATARSTLLDGGAVHVDAFLGALDPHSRYLTPRAYARWAAESHPPAGIFGLYASRPVPGGLRVDGLVEGSPLAATGRLAPGDVLVSVDGEPTADLDGAEVDDLLSRAPHDVELGIARRTDGQLGRPFSVKVTRAVVPGRSSDTEVTLRRELGRRLLMVRLVELNEGTALGVERALQHPEVPIDAVVLDLRDCSGGFIGESAAVAGAFLAGGTVVKTRDASGTTREVEDPTPDMAFGGPVLVLVNEDTASGCEIIAGALQARGRALVAGPNRTFGKGSAQHLSVGPMVGARIVTTDFYYLQDGHSPQGAGLRMDLPLPGRPTEATREADLPYALPAPPPLASWDGPASDTDPLLARSLPALRRMLESDAPPLATPAKSPDQPADWELQRAARAAAWLAEARAQVARDDHAGPPLSGATRRKAERPKFP